MLERTNRSAELVARLRSSFLEEYEKEKDLYDESDIEEIKNNDWYAKRFLLARNRNVDDAVFMVRECFKWRKELRLPIIKDWNFPLEFYKVGALFPYERDLEGNIVVFMRVCAHLKIPELEMPEKIFLMHVFDKADELSNGEGIVVAFDLTKVGYNNVDMEFLRYLLECTRRYFPVGLKYILVINTPWYFTALRKMVYAILPSELVGFIKFANGLDEITQYIAKENLPDYLEGTCKRNYRAVPNGCKSVVDLVDDEFYKDYGTREDIDRIMPTFKKLLDEAENALSISDYVEPEKGFFDEPPPPEEVKILTEAPLQPETTSSFIIENQIFFTYDCTQKCFVGSSTITNLSEQPLAFKIKSNNPQSYSVSPRFGIIHARDELQFFVQTVSEKALDADKFLILYLPISKTRMSTEEFENMWKRGSGVLSTKLSVLFDEDVLLTPISDEPHHELSHQDLLKQIKLLKEECSELKMRQTQMNTVLYLIVLLFIILFLSFISRQLFYSDTGMFSKLFEIPQSSFVDHR